MKANDKKHEQDQSEDIGDDVLDELKSSEKIQARSNIYKDSKSVFSRHPVKIPKKEFTNDSDEDIVAEEREAPKKVYVQENNNTEKGQPVTLHVTIKDVPNKNGEEQLIPKKKVVINSSNELIKRSKAQLVLSPRAPSSIRPQNRLMRNASAKNLRDSHGSLIQSEYRSTRGSTCGRCSSKPTAHCVQELLGEKNVLWEKVARKNVFYYSDKGVAGKGTSNDAYKRYFCRSPGNNTERNKPVVVQNRSRIRDFTSQISVLPGPVSTKQRPETLQMFHSNGKKITDIQKYIQGSYYQQIVVLSPKQINPYRTRK